MEIEDLKERSQKMSKEHQERYLEALKSVSKMPIKEQKRLLEMARNTEPIYMSPDDASILAEICSRQALAEISKMSQVELKAKSKELWQKHVNFRLGKGDSPTIYEYSLLTTINKIIPISLNEIDTPEGGER